MIDQLVGLRSSSRASRVLSGFIGSLLTLAPVASKMAFATAGAGGTMFASPTPLAPYGPLP